MKKIILFIITIIVAIILVSCSENEAQKNSATSDDTTQSTPVVSVPIDAGIDYLDYLFDREKEHLPSDSDAAQIQENMSFFEVIEILGKPHTEAGTSALYIATYIWYTKEGHRIEVLILHTGDAPENAGWAYRELYHSEVKNVTIVVPDSIDTN